jgi:hypothetical protein
MRGRCATPAEAIADATAALRDFIAFAVSIDHRLPAPTAAGMVVLVEEPRPDEIVVLIPITPPAPDPCYTRYLRPKEWEERDQIT